MHGTTYDEAEERSLEIARERGLSYIHPFDDPRIIAGQGTIGLELLERVQPVRLLLPSKFSLKNAVPDMLNSFSGGGGR